MICCGPARRCAVARVALLFTDLTDSTRALLARGRRQSLQGRARALRHGDRRIITKRRGTLVKTIGDAVMAAFVDERDAIAPPSRCSNVFRHFVAAYPRRSGLFSEGRRLRRAVLRRHRKRHSRLFRSNREPGRAVAGRGPCRRGDPRRRGRRRGASTGLARCARPGERFDAVLKGLDTPVRVARIHVDRPATAVAAVRVAGLSRAAMKSTPGAQDSPGVPHRPTMRYPQDEAHDGTMHDEPTTRRVSGRFQQAFDE